MTSGRPKASFSVQPLRPLCLCGCLVPRHSHHRGTEDAEVAQRRILHELSIFVRKEVSIPNSTELTKLYNPLTDSLRLISIQFALSLGVNALYPRQ